MTKSETVSTVKSKSEPWDHKTAKKQFKANLALYKQVATKPNMLCTDDEHLNHIKQLAQELADKAEKWLEKYKALHESTQTVKVSALKPKFCDKKLTTFFSKHFKYLLPENEKYGIIDLQIIAPRAFSLYFKDKGLNNGQYFTLDDELKELFNSPSIGDPSKTYLQLIHDRIHELRSKKDSKVTSSSATVTETNGRITMNFSALKVITNKFGVKYDFVDPDQYISELQTFSNMLNALHDQKEQSKKKPKN